MVANPTVRRAQSGGTWQGSGTCQTPGVGGPGGGGPGGGLVLAVIAAVVLIGSGTASAVVSALVTMAIIIGLVVLGGIGWLVYRLRHDRARRPIAARQVYRPRRAAAPRGLAAARD
jgi:hypothetical protein